MRHVLVLMVVCALGTSVGAQDVLTIEDVTAVPGAVGVEMPVTASNTVPFQGFSLAATYNPTPLDLTGVNYNATIVETILGGVGAPDFSEVVVDDIAGTMTLGVIFELQPSFFVEVPPTTAPGNALVNLVFAVSATALPGDFPIELQDGLGNPPISNVFSSGGQSIFPALVDGVFSIQNLYSFTARSSNVAPGSNVDVIIEVTNETSIEGFTVSVAYDDSILTHVPLFVGNPDCVNPQDNNPQIDCLDLQAFLAPNEVEVITFDEQVVGPDQSWFTMGVVFDFCPPFDGQSLPAGVDQELIKLRFQTTAGAPLGSTTTIDLTDDFPAGSPVTNLVVFETPDGSTVGVPPLLNDGTISFVGGSQFRRGDANADNAVGLADGIFTLNYFFVPGSPQITCFDAADTNDDGMANLTDVIFFLNWFFQGGCPPPPPSPGCGIDSTDGDTLDCQLYPGC